MQSTYVAQENIMLVPHQVVRQVYHPEVVQLHNHPPLVDVAASCFFALFAPSLLTMW